jgi:hypothetical protein
MRLAGVAPRALWPPGWALRHAPWLIAPFVLLGHLWLAEMLLPAQFGFGAADAPPVKIEVAFVRELQPAAPPAAPPRPAPRRRRVVPAVAPAASAPAAVEAAASAPTETIETAETTETARAAETVAEAEPMPTAEAAAAPASTASGADAAPALAAVPAEPAASAAAAFEWPPSTRLSYQLTGQFRGPVEGRASVEWLAKNGRYQVHLEVAIGPPFAPLASRRLSSDGEISDAGLHPRRYDEVTQTLMREPRQVTVLLDEQEVRLANGRTLARPPGVQDSASQFVQMTWLFTMRPELLRAGSSVDVPLALPRRLDTLTYEVLGPEVLETPLGRFDAVHVRPRITVRRGPDLVVEFWVAPTLQNLPIRMVVRQDEANYVDLLLERLPQQSPR